MSEQAQNEMLSPEEQQKQIKEQSSQLGTNLQAFLDQVKLSGRSAEDRQILQVYSGVMEVVEKIISKELVIINADAIFGTAEVQTEEEEND